MKNMLRKTSIVIVSLVAVTGLGVSLYVLACYEPTPTPTPSESVSPTPSPSESASPTPSESVSPSPSESVSPSPSPTEEPTPTPTDNGGGGSSAAVTDNGGGGNGPLPTSDAYERYIQQLIQQRITLATSTPTTIPIALGATPIPKITPTEEPTVLPPTGFDPIELIEFVIVFIGLVCLFVLLKNKSNDQTKL